MKYWAWRIYVEDGRLKLLDEPYSVELSDGFSERVKVEGVTEIVMLQHNCIIYLFNNYREAKSFVLGVALAIEFMPNTTQWWNTKMTEPNDWGFNVDDDDIKTMCRELKICKSE